MQPWLFNTATNGSAYFDNVQLLPVPLLTPVYAGVLDRRAEQLAIWDTLRRQLLTYPEIVADVEWQKALAQNGPLVAVGQSLSSGWTLLGDSTDEVQLASGGPAPLVLYWQGPLGATAGRQVEGWIDLYDGNWLQVLLDAANLVPAGAFENGLSAWQSSLFTEPAAARQLLVLSLIHISSSLRMRRRARKRSRCRFGRATIS